MGAHQHQLGVVVVLCGQGPCSGDDWIAMGGKNAKRIVYFYLFYLYFTQRVFWDSKYILHLCPGQHQAIQQAVQLSVVHHTTYGMERQHITVQVLGEYNNLIQRASP